MSTTTHATPKVMHTSITASHTSAIRPTVPLDGDDRTATVRARRRHSTSPIDEIPTPR